MLSKEETISRLAKIPNLQLLRCASLSRYTRFGIGGPAEVYVEAADEAGFMAALGAVQSAGWPHVVIGGGTNLIVADEGFRGFVLRVATRGIRHEGARVWADTGADLQALVDYTIEHGLRGIETMTGIPGSVGGAIYGNAGAYGHSIMERVYRTRVFDGAGIRELDNAECEFRYRESVFKRRKDWIVFSTELRMDSADGGELKQTADGILKIRNEKYPPTMRCAGSIFKNLIVSELPHKARGAVPERVIREGKAPSAYFLEQAGAKGMRNGGIVVADYHANLIYNEGGGTARELREVIAVLKKRVSEQFGLELEEEVQYVGFEGGDTGTT